MTLLEIVGNNNYIPLLFDVVGFVVDVENNNIVTTVIVVDVVEVFDSNMSYCNNQNTRHPSLVVCHTPRY